MDFQHKCKRASARGMKGNTSPVGDRKISKHDGWQVLSYLLPASKNNVKATVHLL